MDFLDLFLFCFLQPCSLHSCFQCIKSLKLTKNELGKAGQENSQQCLHCFSKIPLDLYSSALICTAVHAVWSILKTSTETLFPHKHLSSAIAAVSSCMTAEQGKNSNLQRLKNRSEMAPSWFPSMTNNYIHTEYDMFTLFSAQLRPADLRSGWYPAYRRLWWIPWGQWCPAQEPNGRCRKQIQAITFTDQMNARPKAQANSANAISPERGGDCYSNMGKEQSSLQHSYALGHWGLTHGLPVALSSSMNETSLIEMCFCLQDHCLETPLLLWLEGPTTQGTAQGHWKVPKCSCAGAQLSNGETGSAKHSAEAQQSTTAVLTERWSGLSNGRARLLIYNSDAASAHAVCLWSE